LRAGDRPIRRRSGSRIISSALSPLQSSADEPADQPKRSSRSWTLRDCFPRNGITRIELVA